MKATTLYETFASLLGVPSCAIPLSFCRILRPYLLERAGISLNGTAMLFVIPYSMQADREMLNRNLSLYAVPRDYHGYVEVLKTSLLPEMQARFPNRHFALFSDHSPISEVEAAARAGLGVRGENGLLITPQWGSYVFIAALMTDADYTAVTGDDVPVFPDEPPHCEQCGACVAACPARNGGACLSALTQKKGKLTPDEIETLRAHPLVWGCDTCQTVCPHNQAVPDTPIPYFREKRICSLTSKFLEETDEDAFASRAFSWRGRSVILRNIKLKEDMP